MKNLKKIFEKYNISVTQKQESQFDVYFTSLIETNKFLNLTAITEENDVLIKHFLDSVLPEKYISANSTVVDIGSGAGFPAIPLKIIRPDLEICMVDSLNKRVNFLNQTISNLSLENTSAVHSRAEDFAKNNREKYDVAVARAVANLNTLAEYLLPLLKIGGSAIIYKSTKLDEELKNAQNAIKILGGEIETVVHYNIEEENLERNVLIIKKISNTPNKYPRSKNAPKTNPLK